MSNDLTIEEWSDQQTKRVNLLTVEVEGMTAALRIIRDKAAAFARAEDLRVRATHGPTQLGARAAEFDWLYRIAADALDGQVTQQETDHA